MSLLHRPNRLRGRTADRRLLQRCPRRAKAMQTSEGRREEAESQPPKCGSQSRQGNGTPLSASGSL